jgi:hypothetical protein
VLTGGTAGTEKIIRKDKRDALAQIQGRIEDFSVRGTEKLVPLEYWC